MYSAIFIVLTNLVCLVVAKTMCVPPKGAILWDPNPGQVIREVTWGYGDDYTCHTTVGCISNSSWFDGRFGLPLDTTPEPVDVQLLPIEMQDGNVLRFVPSPHMGIPFPILPFRVDEEGFLSCDVTGGVPILSAETNQSFEVSQEFLKVGSNYFIVNTSAHALESCDMGLRVNVTVKSNSCHVTHEASCSGWGLCLTYANEPTFQCHCCGNFKGDNCDIFDSCLSYPCRNGGSCFHPSNDSHEYACKCPLGYLGSNCENRTQNLCTVVDCYNNATCTGNSTNFECECPPGLTGTQCEVDINECDPSPCVHGLCVDQRNGFKCVCDPGYYGDTCSERHPQCSLNGCKNGGFCQEMTSKTGQYKFTCHCRRGWDGDDCTVQVPACSPDPCVNGRCVERKGKFKCACDAGFTGTRCEVNINDCDPNPCKFGGHCRDGVHSHTCLCIHSHAGSNCQFTLDMFSPILDTIDVNGAIVHNPEHTRNLYIVAGTLTAAIVIMVVVLVVCYCRISGAHRTCCGITRLFWYTKHRDDLSVSVDVSSASDCPLVVDSFFRSSDSESDIRGSSRLAFQNQTV